MEDRQRAGVAPDDTIAARDLPKETITDRHLAKVEPPDIKPTVRELQARIQDVYFDFDRYDIREDAKPILREVASMLLRNNNLKVIIEGHTDERGTNEYNLGLGDMRATSVRGYLISLGISSGRIETISYGEERPACKEQTEECWAINRRAHFVLFEEIR
jgi:peptidoglycan-associated lipoprotein